MNLRSIDLKEQFITGEDNLIDDFFIPCLSHSKTYDRAAGFFNSSIYSSIKPGLEPFIRNGGKIRLITSVRLSEEDINLIRSGYEERQLLEDKLQSLYHEFYLKRHDYDVANLCWLIKCGRLDLRIIIPDCSKMGDEAKHGIFHDKLGVFSDDNDDFIVFFGSNNESKGGWLNNLESFEVFCSWDEGVVKRADFRKKYFERLWKPDFDTIKTYEFPDAFRQQLIEMSPSEFHYEEHGSQQKGNRTEKQDELPNKWRHQDEAISAFLEVENGILEMATGTGKTRTAIEIVNKLLFEKNIESVIVTVSGIDLLDQWYEQLGKYTDLNIFRYYDYHKELSSFILNPKRSVLLVSRDFLEDTLKFVGRSQKLMDKTIIICDEVHGMGSPKIVQTLRGQISPFKYRLGLSATPEREYGDEGNQFILEEIGGVVYRFKLEDAIKRGILCEFDYHPLEYELTQEDRTRLRDLIASHNAKKKAGESVSNEELFRNLAHVKKISQAKLPVFESFLGTLPEILNRCILFAETKEFGEQVQHIIIQYEPSYHTYYGDDHRENLVRFSQGELISLLTCKRISEGIDIKSVNNIVLFSADRALLQTIQRIGRCLRTEPNNPNKRARVVDFISVQGDDESDEPRQMTADEDRRLWLQELSLIRREE